MGADIFCCYLDENISVGTVTEIMWATSANKKIWVFYKEIDTEYSLKSDYWFVLKAAEHGLEEKSNLR